MKKILLLSLFAMLVSFSAFADCDPNNYASEIETAFKNQFPSFFIRNAHVSDTHLNNLFDKVKNLKNWSLGDIQVNKNDSSISLGLTEIWVHSNPDSDASLVKAGPNKKNQDGIHVDGAHIKFNYKQSATVTQKPGSGCLFYYLLDPTPDVKSYNIPNDSLYVVFDEDGFPIAGTKHDFGYLILGVPSKE